MGRCVCVLLAAGCALAALGAWSATASAQTDDELARAHHEAATAYFRQGRYDDAAREFAEAYRLSPRPALLENLARAEERGLHFCEAIETLERLRTEHPDESRATQIEDRMTSLRELAERQGGCGGGDPPPPPERGSSDGLVLPGAILMASGGALGIGALVTGLIAHGIYEDLATSCPDGCGPARAGDIDTGEALALTSTIFTFVAPVVAGVGLVLILIDPGGATESPSGAQVSLSAGPTFTGIRVRGAF